MSLRKIFLASLIAVGAAQGGCHKLQSLVGGGEPQRKPGLWEETIVSDRAATPMLVRLCFDAASDRRMPALPRQPRRAGACSKYQVSRSGGGWTIDMVCSRGAASFERHTVVSGDFSSRYVEQTTTTITGASDAARNGAHNSTITAVYKGGCPSDIGPGQVQLPSGDVVDMASLRRGFGGPGGGPGGRSGGGGPGGGGPPGGG